MDTLLKQLRVFDFVILDSPPMSYFVDAETLADKVDSTMLVVRQDCTPAAEINGTIQTLQSCKSQFLGCILNDITFSLTEGYGGYGHYGYGDYGYGHYGYSHYGSSNSKKHPRHRHSSDRKKGG